MVVPGPAEQPCGGSWGLGSGRVALSTSGERGATCVHWSPPSHIMGVWVPTSSPSVSLGLGDPTAGRSGAISLRENVSSRAGQPGLGQARYLGSGVLLPRAPGLFTILASMGHGNGALRGYTGSRSSFPQGPRQDPSRLLSYPLPDTCRYMIMHLHGLARWEGRTGVPPPLRKAPGCPCKGSFFRTGMIGRETRALQG